MDDAVLITIREALEKSGFPEVVGAVIFGSRAKETATAFSDIDLLVLCNGINIKRHRRGGEITAIKKHLPELPIDILLLTPQEVELNFRNHNPLFLDIAEEGIILIDDQGWLQRMMEETLNYIKQRGIRKTDHGWVFPVTRGAPTYL